MSVCLFCRVISGEIPARIVYQDDLVMVFHDISPQAPIHVLIIPKVHIQSLNELSGAISNLGSHILLTASKIATELGIGDSGYRLVFNTQRDGGQTVFHLHAHLLGGRSLEWPPG